MPSAEENLDYEEIRSLLVANREDLQRRLSGVKRDLGQLLDRDSSEQAVELENRGVLEALKTEAVVEIAAIENALRRLEDNTYGICTSCGNEIPVGRLKARPHARLCVQCKERRE